MALKNNFYNEIFTNEQEWINLINAKLLNSIYCNLKLKPFYIQKLEELKQEYSFQRNEIIEQIIRIITNIIKKIDSIYEQYKNLQNPDVSSLNSFFLITQMNNMYSNNFNNKESIKNKTIKNEELIINNYDDDYMYDDFPEKISRIK